MDRKPDAGLLMRFCILKEILKQSKQKKAAAGKDCSLLLINV